jgi:hypothetical protein
MTNYGVCFAVFGQTNLPKTFNEYCNLNIKTGKSSDSSNEILKQTINLKYLVYFIISIVRRRTMDENSYTFINI